MTAYPALIEFSVTYGSLRDATLAAAEELKCKIHMRSNNGLQFAVEVETPMRAYELGVSTLRHFLNSDAVL